MRMRSQSVSVLMGEECRIMPNIFADHSALILTICFDEETAPRGPGYWRFNNSLLSDNEYVALLRSKIPEFVEKYKEVEDKGLFWEMVKMEIRGLTVRFSKLKAKRNHDEEKLLTSTIMDKSPWDSTVICIFSRHLSAPS